MEKTCKIENETQFNTCNYFDFSERKTSHSPAYIEALQLLRKLFELLNY